jgi:hypothetical protein
VRGRPDEYNVVAFYMQDSRILSAVAINRGKDILRAMSLIKAGVQVDTDKLRDENIDLRSLLPGARPIRPPHTSSRTPPGGTSRREGEMIGRFFSVKGQ